MQDFKSRAKFSLNPRHLQHIQRPTPSHLSKNTPSLQGVGRADVAEPVSRETGLCESIPC